MDNRPNSSLLLFKTTGNVPMPSVLARFRLGPNSNLNDDIYGNNHIGGMVSSLGIKLREQHGDVHGSGNPGHIVPRDVFH